MSTALAARIAAEYAAAAPGLPTRIVNRARRELAVQTLSELGLPAMREENWKYANLRTLERMRFAPRVPAGVPPHIPATALPAPIAGYPRYTFVDGAFAPELSSAARAAAPDGLAGARAAAGDARFALLNDAFATDAATLRIAAQGPPSCVEVLFVAYAAGAEAASYPRLEVEVAAGARLNLIERHVSAGAEAAFVATAIDIDLAHGAGVTHFRVQELAARSTWIDTLSATVGADGVYQQFLVQLGALAARSTCHLRLTGARAAARVHALAAAAQNQTQDAYALIEHAAAHTVSEQVFRGIAAGRARVGFNGKVSVRAGAAGTDSRQSLRGLLAGPEAEIDVRPQLEIHTDDVRCSHGATAGKLDESLLFYLLSRGLDPDTAQQLLKWAFLADVVAKIDIPELKRSIERALAGRIDVAADLKELL